jgi:hypothetical protein
MGLPTSYLTSFKNLGGILAAIQNAQAPKNFTTRFLESLGYKSGVLPKVLLTGRSLESLPPGSQPGSASRAPSGAPGYCSPRSSR